MAFIGSWGGVTFSVSRQTVKTFDGLKRESGVKYAAHDRHLEEPLLEFTGPDTESISFSMFFSVLLRVNPIAEVDTREMFGHWEGDKVYSKKDGSKALFVLTGPLTRREIIVRIKDRTTESVVKALDRIERKYGPVLFRKIFQTITVDNGGEFAGVNRLERSAFRKTLNRTKVYFCQPYSSYERGSNECQNKMIRRPFPKGTDFGKVTAAGVARAEQWMNNYPRKILGRKTPEKLFRECVADLI